MLHACTSIGCVHFSQRRVLIIVRDERGEPCDAAGTEADQQLAKSRPELRNLIGAEPAVSQTVSPGRGGVTHSRGRCEKNG